MLRVILVLIGFVFVIGTFAGGLDRFLLLADWSTGELVGYNLTTIILPIIGGVILYYAWKAKKKK